MTQRPAALSSIGPLLLTGLQASLFVVATVIVFIDEARSPAVVMSFYVLWTLSICKGVWDAWCDWRRGLLSLPLSQLHRMIAEQGVKRTSLLEVTSMLMGFAAMASLTF